MSPFVASAPLQLATKGSPQKMPLNAALPSTPKTQYVLRCITREYKGIPMSITSIRLADDLDKPLESLASKLDRSKNYLINQAIKEFLSRQSLEDSRWSDTLVALESVKSGKSLAEADVNAWLNSWGTGDRKQAPK